MSKSKGNGVDPMKMASIYGADILRLWTASVDYQSDVRFGEDMVKRVSESYRKIRNTFKFMLGNLFDFNRKKDSTKEFAFLDLMILATLEKVKNTVIQAMDHYDFVSATSTMMNFMSSDLSSFYLDVNKDVLYCDKENSLRRRQVQTVIDRCLDVLMRLWSPILSFTMEEVFQNDPNHEGEYCALLDYPEETHFYDEYLLQDYAKFLSFRNDVLKALEVKRGESQIGSAQEAHVYAYVADKALKEQLQSLSEDELARLFVVSKMTIVDEMKDNEAIHVEKHNGVRCDRCWNYVDHVHDVLETHVCDRCYDVLKEFKDEEGE